MKTSFKRCFLVLLSIVTVFSSVSSFSVSAFHEYDISISERISSGNTYHLAMGDYDGYSPAGSSCTSYGELEEKNASEYTGYVILGATRRLINHEYCSYNVSFSVIGKTAFGNEKDILQSIVNNDEHIVTESTDSLETEFIFYTCDLPSRVYPNADNVTRLHYLEEARLNDDVWQVEYEFTLLDNELVLAFCYDTWHYYDD